MRREVIRFLDSEPVRLILDSEPNSGLETRGKFGTDYRYSVNDGKAVMYLPAEGKEALLDAGVRAGDEVAISKRGRGRWDVEILLDREFEREQQERQESRSRLRPFEDEYQPGARSLRSIGRQPAESSRPVARQRESQAREPETPPPPPVNYTAQHLMSCLCVAIDAASEAQEYARKKGLNIVFTGGDLRAMANSVYINDDQRSREAS